MPKFICPHFICPHCQSPLMPHVKTWHCDGSLNDKHTQHPFDVAKQGYVNLLPVQNKKSKAPGDSQDSIDARHRFLSQGFYQPLQQAISHIATQISNDKDNVERITWLDIGCGEGYYTQAVAQSLSNPNATNVLIALDISKPAVTTTAKVAKQNQQLWYQLDIASQTTAIQKGTTANVTAIYPMVASASQLPLADNSINAISTIFSPILPTEFARVLTTGGHLLIAKPDAGHLQSMREALFDEVRPHDSDKFLDELTTDFKLVNTYQLTTDLRLNKQLLADLLTMTPYSYRAKASKREALLAQADTDKQAFTTQACFVVYELQKL